MLRVLLATLLLLLVVVGSLLGCFWAAPGHSLGALVPFLGALEQPLAVL